MFVNREAQVVWASLEFRKPVMLQIVEALAAEQLHWVPPHGRNSIAWLLWHIAEVEDNWIRDLWLGEPRRYPFGRSVRDASRGRRHAGVIQTEDMSRRRGAHESSCVRYGTIHDTACAAPCHHLPYVGASNLAP
jgi:hypothetical protein